jgi:C-terminal processing protease CtpA/Prc
MQIENLATLGKVWGFVKYHHPEIVSGARHWDYDLFRVLPDVLAARDRTSAAASMHKWLASLPAVSAPPPSVAVLETSEPALRPAIAWISDENLLGAELSADLRHIYQIRAPNNFYVSLAPYVRDPIFDHEPDYARVKFPDAGYQILALYRFWNIIEYWYPNRDIPGQNWDRALADSLSPIALAPDSEAYKRELLKLIALVRDTHANLWSSLASRPPVGACQMPVVVRFVEGKAVVTGSAARDHATGGLSAGDVIEDLDGTPVDQLVERWRPYYADSNEAARLRDIAASMTRGVCGPSHLRVQRGSEMLTATVTRVPMGTLDPLAGSTHDRPGSAFQKLSDDVAYLKLSNARAADAASYVKNAAGTKGLIIDIRNYPSEFVVFALGSLLVDKPVDFVRSTIGDLANPGVFHWGEPVSLMPAQPHYNGKVVIIVDEVSQSNAEYTAMALRAAANAVVVGSTTAGADGNTSPFALPGGLRSMISGIGVFYPDKKPTQRIGILADVPAKPTIGGIRAGRDEVLETAIRQIVGTSVPEARIEAMAKP